MVHINCIDFNEKNHKRITTDVGEEGGGGGGVGGGVPN